MKKILLGYYTNRFYRFDRFWYTAKEHINNSDINDNFF